MINHKKILVQSRSIGEQDYFGCEWCFSAEVNDAHHIEEKGIGGRKGADTEDNLIGLCRPCHTKAHQGLITKDELKARVAHILHTIQTGNAHDYHRG